MLLRWRGGVILLGIFLIIGHALAYSACPALVQNALQSIATSCEGISRNQVCYGNFALHATPHHDAPAFNFENVGDIVDVLHLQSLKLDPLDEVQGVWGLAMMQLQADIPDTLPGQNVTFLLFGDVEIENRSTAKQSPMQAFYLRSGVGDSACLEAPASGVLIQTPHGVESVNFNINGVDVEVGSTVMLQAQPSGNFTIRTLEGAAVVTVNGAAYPIIAGTQTTLPVNEQMQVAGRPSLPTPLSEIGLETPLISPLPRHIEPPAPLPDDALIKLHLRLESGLEPCGVPGLPACEHALAPDPERDWAIQAAPVSEGETDIILPASTLAENPDLSIVPDAADDTTTQSVVGNPPLLAEPVIAPATSNGVSPTASAGSAPNANQQPEPANNPPEPPTGNQPPGPPPPSVEQPPAPLADNSEEESGNKDKKEKVKEKKEKEDKEKKEK